MAAFCCFIVRSAAAMSGRRSSSVEGSRTGGCGAVSARSRWEIDTSAGGLPISTAMACSFCLRATSTLISCACADEQQRLRGDDVGLGRRAGVVLILRDLQRALVLLDGVGEQVAQRIGLAQLHIGERQRRLRRQRGVGEIGGARLRRRAVLLDLRGARGPRRRASRSRRPARSKFLRRSSRGVYAESALVGDRNASAKDRS